MRSIIGITIFLLLGVAAAAWLYFSNLTTDSRSTEKTLAVIPGDAAIIVRMANDKGSFDLFKDYHLFNDITGDQKQKELSALKKLAADNPEIYSLSQQQNIFISIHPSGEQGSAFLYTMPVQKTLEADELDELLRSTGLKASRNGSGNISLITLSGQELPGNLYISFEKGIFMASFTKELLDKAISPGTPKLKQAFLQEISQTMSKESASLVNIFLNHAQPGFLNNYLNNSISGNLGLFKSFDAYSSFSMNFKSNALMLNGNTHIRQGQNGYLNLFLNQQPAANTIRRFLPYNVANSICYGVSDYNRFQKDFIKLLGQRRELDSLNAKFTIMTSETGVNAERDIKPLWGNEFSNIQLSTHETLAIIRVSNSTQLGFYLEPLSDSYAENIRKLNYADLLYFYFGDPLKKFERPFFVVKDNLLIVSNSPGTLQRYISDYENDRLLPNYSAYTRFSQYVADQGNISFFMHSKNSKSLVKSWLKRPYDKDFLQDDKGINNFYALSFQLTSNSDHFFANFYLDDNADVTLSSDSTVYTTKDID